MTCCEPIIHNFVAEAVTNIPWGDYERSVYGDMPIIDLVYYLAPDWVVGGVFTEVKYQTNNIRIDHGGISTGYAKIG